jgi:hypothetical protein
MQKKIIFNSLSSFLEFVNDKEKIIEQISILPKDWKKIETNKIDAFDGKMYEIKYLEEKMVLQKGDGFGLQGLIYQKHRYVFILLYHFLQKHFFNCERRLSIDDIELQIL